jgi:hypothetical protein
VPVAAPGSAGVELHRLQPSVAVFEHRDLRPDALEPHHAVHPTAIDRRLGLQLGSGLDEEHPCGCEVVDHDAHVLHAFDRHALDDSVAGERLAPGELAGPPRDWGLASLWVSV